MKKINLQLYSFGNDSPLSLLEKIKCAGEIGFTGVEFARGYDGIEAADLKKALDDAGLTAESAHVGLPFMEQDIPYLAQIGCKWVICPMAAFNTVEETKELADDLNRLGDLAAKYGMKVGYHNHTDEFYKVDGKYLQDWLIEFTNPETVDIELDCGWASAAGIDPVEYINTHAGRIAGIHIKENSDVVGASLPRSRREPDFWSTLERDENGKPIIPPEFLKLMEERDRLNVAQGTGIVDWKAIKVAAESHRDDVIFIVERECSYGGMERIDCLKEDIVWLHENL